jgi:hypothetical protein
MTHWISLAPIVEWYKGQFIASGNKFDLGHGVSIQQAPAWLSDEQMKQDLGFNQKEILQAAKYCFVVEYEANSLGDPESAGGGQSIRSKQNVADEKIKLANLSLWLAKPSFISFELMVHVEKSQKWVWRQASTYNLLMPHDRDVTNVLDLTNLSEAKSIFGSILSLPREGSVWVACHTLWMALTQAIDYWSLRYLLLWICLEALFGANSEITYKISQRIAFFLERDRKKTKVLFDKAKQGYKCRSEIVHGMNLSKGNIHKSEHMLYDSEWFVREALKKILLDAALINDFKSNKAREHYLDGLIFT